MFYYFQQKELSFWNSDLVKGTLKTANEHFFNDKNETPKSDFCSAVT